MTFKLRSGNKTSFKSMGSSPVKQQDSVVIGGKTYPKGYTKKDVEFLKKQREDVVRYEDLDAKGKAIWKKQGKPVPTKKKSPAKQTKDKNADLKEFLISEKGFSQEDADTMIRSGAYTKGDIKSDKTKGKASEKVKQEDWKPAYEGADYSKEEIAKMTKEEKRAKISDFDDTVAKPKNKKSPTKQLKHPPLSENEKKILETPKKHDAHVRTTKREMFLKGKTVSGKDIKWTLPPKYAQTYGKNK